MVIGAGHIGLRQAEDFRNDMWKDRAGEMVCYMGVSKKRGTPKSSILMGFPLFFIIHFGVPLFLETSIYSLKRTVRTHQVELGPKRKGLSSNHPFSGAICLLQGGYIHSPMFKNA